MAEEASCGPGQVWPHVALNPIGSTRGSVPPGYGSDSSDSRCSLSSSATAAAPGRQRSGSGGNQKATVTDGGRCTSAHERSPQLKVG